MRKRLAGIFLFILLGASTAWGQDCRCLDSGNCPLPITTNSSGQVCYTISEASNNDLADPAQGICGVQVNFTHQHIWNLELWLEGPNGQIVQLIGPYINTFGTTNNVQWNMLFIPCSAPPNPDVVNGVTYEGQWNNNQNWPFAANFTGSYHPYNGCLEDFSTGVVNGEWCLNYSNLPSTYTGQMLDFEIILCDNSGILCCEALGGSLSGNPDVLRCEGDSSLVLDISPSFGAFTPPSPLDYGYTYVVSDENGLVWQIDTLPDLSSFPAGEYSVCGLSYRLDGRDSIPVPNGSWTLDSLDQLINGFNPSFCGDLSSSCVSVDIVAPPTPVVLDTVLCEGGSISIDSLLFDQTGTYDVVLQTAAGCDSLITLNLTVLTNASISLTDTLCNGQGYQVGDSLYTATGLYQTILTDQQGCDSLVWLDLFVFPELFDTVQASICAGEIYALGDSTFTASGTYEVLLSSYWGCDSLVTLALDVLNPEAQIVAPDTLTCDVQELWLDGSASGGGPGLSFQWFTQDGLMAGPVDGDSVLIQAAGNYQLIVSQGICSDTASVAVVSDTLVPVPTAGPAAEFICSTDSLQLQGAYPGSGSGILVQWSTATGSLLSGDTTLSPWVGAPGTYTLTLLNTVNGCTASDEVLIGANLQAPAAEAGPAATLTCTQATALLDGTASEQQPDFTYTWSNGAGQVLNPSQELVLPVSAPGWYFLEIVNTTNNCVGLDSVLVDIDTISPVADAGSDTVLTCILTEVELGGAGTSPGANFTYEWLTIGGSFSGSVNQPTATATAPGTYMLQVENTENGCLASDTVQVTENTEHPLALAGEPITLNCSVLTWQLGDAGSSQGPEFEYLWLGEQGDTLGTVLFLSVSSGGLYELVVTNTLNGCTDQDTVLMGQNQLLPTADAGPDTLVDCFTPLVSLGGPNTSAGVFVEYEWFNSTGASLGVESTLTVNQGDTYCLVVTNGQNFCADTACVLVLQDQALPNAQLQGESLLDCETGTATLDASGSSTGPAYTYIWSGPAGILPTGPADLQVPVNLPGTYQLEVFDADNACSNFASFTVGIDTLACTPQALAGADGLVNCYHPLSDTLDASASSAGPFIAYSWEALSGEIFHDEETLFPVVGPGLYVLTVTNTLFGFSATDTVQVASDFTPPVAVAGQNVLLDCETLGNNFSLDGTGSSLGAQYEYLWSSDGGNILSGETTLNPLVNLPGLYDLQVLNTLNGCFDTDAVLVDLDGDIPEICLPEVVLIPCGIASTILADTCGLSNPNYVFSWSVSGGTILTDPTLPSIEAAIDSTQGFFTLFVTDTSNLCVRQEVVEVVGPLACFPDCAVNVPDTLTCDLTQVVLDGTGSSLGPDFGYTWTAITGNLCGPDDQLQTCADAPGLYRLTVTDLVTNFTCSEDVLVIQNITAPIAEAGPDGTLSCVVAQAELDGSGSSQGAFQYDWTGPAGAGCVVENAQNDIAFGNCPGWYRLEVRSIANGCVDMDSTWVGIDTLPPVAVLVDPDPITCSNGTSVINGMGSTQGPGVMYTWTFNGGFLVSSPSATTLQASQTGTYCLTVFQPVNGCQATSCVNLEQDDTLPQVIAGPPNLTYTCLDTSFTLNSVVVGTSFYDSAWSTVDGCLSGPLNQANATANCPGTYEITVTDLLNNCSVTESVLIADNSAPPLANAGPDTLIDCASPSVLLDGSASASGPGISYAWTAISGGLTNPLNQPQAEANQAGIYQLTVLNTLTGCSATDLVEVLALQTYPNADAGPDAQLNCANPTALLDGSNSAGPNPISFQWSAGPGGSILTGADTPAPTVGSPGLYVLTVQDVITSCQSSDTVQVLGDFEPPQALVSFPNGSELSCATTQLLADGSSSTPAGSLNYQWLTGAGTSLSTNNQQPLNSSGTYVLIVTSLLNGCADTLTFSITENTLPPELQIAIPDTLSCARSSIQLDAQGSSQGPAYSYQWSSPQGHPIDNPTQLTPTVYQPGMYELLITDSSNGCTAQGQISVHIDTLPPLAQASALGQLSCDNPEVPLSTAGSAAGTGISYLWSGPGLAGSASNPVANTPGWYLLEVTAASNGCTGADSVLVTASSLPIYGLELALQPPRCPGDRNGQLVVDSVLGGLPPYLYGLNGQTLDGYNRFFYLPAGSYQLQVEDSQGCTWDTLLQLADPPLLNVDLGPDRLVPLGTEVVLNATLTVPADSLGTVVWKPSIFPDCPSCLTQQVLALENTLYQIEVTDLRGCPAHDEVFIRVLQEVPVYLGNAFSPNGDGQNDVFFVQAGPGVQEVQRFQIFDRWGELVFERHNFPPNDPLQGWDGMFQGQILNPQVLVYQLELRLANGEILQLQGDVTLMR